MAVRTRRRPPKAVRFTVGPWNQVVDTNDPFDDTSDTLVDASNIWIPDPDGLSGAYARSGFSLQNSGSPLYTSGSVFRGQGAFSHTALDGTTTNFAVFGGHLFRMSANLSSSVDVSPVGITMDTALTTRVYGTSFADQLIITDGVNRPWLATNLASTPITGTYIDFDSVGGDWSAFGPFRVYGGSIFCVLNSVGGVDARTDLAWSVPADAATGWQQTDYDFRWTLEQTGSDAIYGLAPTETRLYYFRENSIGSISGTPGPDLSGQSTHDAVSRNIGTITPQSIVQFGTTIFFTDVSGRPYSLVDGGGAPDAIWLKMRAVVDNASSNFPGVNQSACTAAFDPATNRYIVAPWSATPSQSSPATEAYCFDARTGKYQGRLSIAAGVQLEAMGNFLDANGRGILVVVGSASAPTASAAATSGYCWSLNNFSPTFDYLVTEDGLFYLRTEGQNVVDAFITEGGLTFVTEGGVTLGTEDVTASTSALLLTTESLANNWSDNGIVPTISITTTRMGYQTNAVVNVDRINAIVGSSAPCTVSAATAALTQTVEGTPTPSVTQDGQGRIVCGFDGVQGRGIEITVSPTTAADQWSLQQITVDAVLAGSPPDEP